MSTIFISHSSKDDARSKELEAWLRAQGFSDLFIDYSSIEVGAKWADALRSAAGACRIVICIVTPHWLSSSECLGEFLAAWYMGKRIAPLFLLGDETVLGEAPREALRRIRAEAQGIDITPLVTAEGRIDFARDEGRCEHLRQGLKAAGALSGVGLDPSAFAIDRALRPVPFPGLASFGDDDADAALFFGRSREIAETLEILRGMRAIPSAKALVILGASGAGKSSLLKAGIIPRLRREAPAWIPLRAFRPGGDPLLGFAEAIARTFAEFGVVKAPGALRQEMLAAWIGTGAGENAHTPGSPVRHALEELARRLRSAAARPQATILIAIDQAEELVRGADSAEALCDYLRAASELSTIFRLVFTIRTDSFSELQGHRRFHGLETSGYDLRSLPIYRFSDVVEAPAGRYGVEIDPALVDALMEEAPEQDALPLLAFAVQRLWNQFAAKRAIRADDYRAMGGLQGLIEDAAERALGGCDAGQAEARSPRGVSAAQAELGARTFVPPLADVNEDGATIRRVAAWRDFGEEQRALLSHFARWRLVVRKGGADGGTVEVAHEALFRKWARLAAWLEPERARLESLRALEVAAAAWTRSGRKKGFATHAGRRLGDARALKNHPRYGPQMSPAAADYIAACQVAARGRAWALAGAVLAVPAAIAIGYLAVLAFTTIRAETLQSRSIARYQGHVVSAAQLANAAPAFAFQDCRAGAADCPIMIVLPAGEFLMGSSESDPYVEADEFPRHRVSIPRLAVSKFEITWDEWQACLNSGGCNGYRPDDAGMGRGRKPIAGVSWIDAQNYVKWLSRMTGVAYRLLSESEWEYAARGTTSLSEQPTAYGWGDKAPVCVPAAENGASFNFCNPKRTRDAGTFAANRFGLYDMHGNVWEWVADCHAPYQPANSDAAAVETQPCRLRVARGGSFYGSAQVLRSANRDWDEPASRTGNYGFRVARPILLH